MEKHTTDDLFKIVKNNKDEIQSLDYNTSKVNKMIKEINSNIQNKLLKLENGETNELSISNNFKKGKFKKTKNGVLCEIPFGSLRGNSLYSNIGPSIPIRLSFLGQVKSKIKSKITNYGINNLVIEIYLETEITEQITMPMTSNEKNIKIESPLTIKIIEGKVPEYYNNSNNIN